MKKEDIVLSIEIGRKDEKEKNRKKKREGIDWNKGRLSGKKRKEKKKEWEDGDEKKDKKKIEKKKIEK